MLDDYEDQSQLHISEWNFRHIVKIRFDHLLSCTQSYSKQQCTARCAKLGEKNTPYHHAMVTMNFHRNSIAALARENGSLAIDHEEKASFLWHTYKKKLGISIGIDQHFDFTRFLSNPQDLSALSTPFTMQEIDKITKALPNNRAPGPYDFTGLFTKKR